MNKEIAIVTGATKGIGLAIAQSLVEEGYEVHGTYTSDYSKKDLAKLLEPSFYLHRVDGSDFDACNKFINTLDKNRVIGVLVNNAGIVKDGLLMKMSSDDFEAVIDVNLKGTFNMTQVLSRRMLRQRKGSIVNISSVIGVMGNIGQANYAASKAGIIGFTKSVAKEFAPRNIRVNCVAPGFIETTLTQSLDTNYIEELKKEIPLQRLGQVEDVANLVAFLVSDKANYITGQVIQVCGGLVI